MSDEIRMALCLLREEVPCDGKWLAFLRTAENLVGARLSRLDENDPVRRKVDRLEDAAAYVCRFGEKEDSRRLFGRFEKSKIEFSISLFRRASRFSNSVDVHFPEKMASVETERLWSAFSELVKLLDPFYAFCDLQSAIAGKRKATRTSVDLEAELVGVFWLTHFDRKWVDFIGAARFDELTCEKTMGMDGATLRLGKTPSGLLQERETTEAVLGRRFFVDPESRALKRPGENALTYDQMKR